MDGGVGVGCVVEVGGLGSGVYYSYVNVKMYIGTRVPSLPPFASQLKLLPVASCSCQLRSCAAPGTSSSSTTRRRRYGEAEKGALITTYAKLPENERPTIACPRNEEGRQAHHRAERGGGLPRSCGLQMASVTTIDNADSYDVCQSKSDKQAAYEPRGGDSVRGDARRARARGTCRRKRPRGCWIRVVATCARSFRGKGRGMHCARP